MITAGDVIDSARNELSSAANDLWNEVRQDGADALDRIRQSLANAVGDLATGAVNKATGAIAPPGQAPVSIPLTQSRMLWIVGALLVLVVLVVFFARRRG